MNTKLQAQPIEEAVVISTYGDTSTDKVHDFSTLAAVNDAKIVQAENSKPKKATVMLKNIGLFFAAPFIALAYVIALPFVGFYMFSKLALEAKTQNG